MTHTVQWAEMSTARKSMEGEIDRLRHQRSRYLLAAHAAPDRHLALRHLLEVERLADEIDGIAEALVALDDHTIPVAVGRPG